MDKEFIVKDHVSVKASPKEVWHALTTPELTKKYFFKSEALSSWKVGSPLIFKRKILGIPLSLKGTIEKIEPEKMLQYRLVNTKLFGKPDPNHFSFITIKLSHDNEKTTVRVSDDVGSYEGAQKRFDRSVKGWSTILTGLKELLEKR